ncbi:LysR substrate-binding domain-containing protein [Aliiglaciecola litoralis]|uniref:LysR substrate-binding domain-containing protein n=1 Tax=Aliiglaciecola litoralis TaxID=582857 RepID=A0ABN1LST3_9ALTE
MQHHLKIVYSRLSSKLILEQGKEVYSVPLLGTLFTHDATARLKFTFAGQGLAVLPEYDIQPQIASGTLIEVLQDYSQPNLKLFAVFPRGATQANAVKLMLELLKQYPPHKLALIDV